LVTIAHGAFSATLNGSGTTGGGGTATFSGSFAGSFDSAGLATGTLQVHFSVDESGTHYECDTGSLTWTAR
jgi:hypothetical protein